MDQGLAKEQHASKIPGQLRDQAKGIVAKEATRSQSSNQMEQHTDPTISSGMNPTSLSKHLHVFIIK